MGHRCAVQSTPIPRYCPLALSRHGHTGRCRCRCRCSTPCRRRRRVCRRPVRSRVHASLEESAVHAAVHRRQITRRATGLLWDFTKSGAIARVSDRVSNHEFDPEPHCVDTYIAGTYLCPVALQYCSVIILEIVVAFIVELPPAAAVALTCRLNSGVADAMAAKIARKSVYRFIPLIM